MTANQIAKWNNPRRKPFRFFKSLQEELAATTAYWRERTPLERLEYLEFMRCVVFGEETVNAKMVRCYGWRKRDEEDYAPENIVYF